jgi:transcription-repair coupling factor (superfamily II helicase)
MYQLRGRVGRRGQRAYAYLLHPQDRALTEEAYERLRTIGEFTDLGSGFKIAMRDLEIRGAGNLLGGEQSGHIAAVGFDLYCQLVTEAVGELKGEVPEVPLEITIDLPVQAHLPKSYVSRDDVRMEAYRRLAAVTDPADVDDVRAEWVDRYGSPPAAAAALLDLARLRAECVRLGIRSITMAQRAVRIRGLELKPSQEVRLKRLAAGARVNAEEAYLPWASDPARAAAELTDLLEDLVPREIATPIGSAAP